MHSLLDTMVYFETNIKKYINNNNFVDNFSDSCFHSIVGVSLYFFLEVNL